MSDNTSLLIDEVKDGEWLILSKNSLFWKGRLDPSEDDTSGTILSISYGKSLSLALKAETSQAFEHSCREKALVALGKLLKEKSKNGYTLYSTNTEEKENKPDTRGGKKSPLPIKSNRIQVEAVEHQCKHIPLILTEDFEDKIAVRTAEKQRDQTDASLGKRQKSTETKAEKKERMRRINEDEDLTDYPLPATMTLTEIFDKP